ncbi:MAG: acyclic terpene utilization AtuA family protein [Pseudomonadota bacterium]|nr:acyclic terpene utilization AtuA family protein [Pseudomonadota bacterium]
MTSTQARPLRIGGATGYWGDSGMATPQFLKAEAVDAIVFDYLAEITLSIMARARAADPAQGYARDFVTAVLKPNLAEIARQGVKIVSNAGGMNPDSCAEAVRALIAKEGLGLTVAVVSGDDLVGRAGELRATEMFSGAPFPPAEKIASINAYLGAAPIAAALRAGADIVVTGRVADSAVTLGLCMAHFGWAADDWDRLSAGTLAGHILECGAQATGGNFTDWEEIADTMADIGYPVAEIAPDGSFEVTKPEGTGGRVSVGTVAEQMLYEIGDPQAYLVPDVACDFSAVRVEEVGPDRVRVTGAKGLPAPATLKVSCTWMDGFRGGMLWTFAGPGSDRKARAFGAAALTRARGALRASNLGDFSETSIEVIGADSQYGDFGRAEAPREVVLKLAARHAEKAGLDLLIRETTGLGLAGPPGLSGFAGGRPKPSPVLRLFSFEIPREAVPVEVTLEGAPIPLPAPPAAVFERAAIARPAPPADPGPADAAVPLAALAWGRSGDKGDKANVGIIARRPDYLPWLWAALTPEVVAARFAHFAKGGVDRYLLPGPPAINFLLHEALGGGGVASLRNDPQAKAWAQLLLDMPIPVPRALADSLTGPAE